VALLATAVTAFLPILMGMSRLYYTENFLTTVLLLNLLALVKSGGFQRRGWALVWGITLGLALLVKWTAPIYIVLPTLFVLRDALRTTAETGTASVPGTDQQPAGHRQARWLA
jgi:4-amino-4-deoxy-L-arabinose transferase-like glycosyltransferase